MVRLVCVRSVGIVIGRRMSFDWLYQNIIEINSVPQILCMYILLLFILKLGAQNKENIYNDLLGSLLQIFNNFNN